MLGLAQDNRRPRRYHPALNLLPSPANNGAFQTWPGGARAPNEDGVPDFQGQEELVKQDPGQ